MTVFVFISLSFMAGIGCARYFPWFVAAAICCCGIIMLRRAANTKTSWWLIFAVAIWFWAGFGRYEIQENRLLALLESIPERPERVAAMAQMLDPAVPTRFAVKSRARITAWRHNAIWQPADFIVMLYRPQGPESWNVGDQYLLEGEISRFSTASNEGGWDARSYYLRRQIVGKIYVRSEDPWTLTEANSGLFQKFKQWRSDWQSRCSEVLDQKLKPRNASVLKALLWGDKQALGYDTKRLFQQTGTYHLLVISGCHVGLIAIFFEVISRLIGLNIQSRCWVIGCGLIFYGMVVEPAIPVNRAVVMALWLLIARYLDWPVYWAQAVCGAAWLLLWWNPFYCTDPGWWLSFGAVVSLFVLATRLTKTLGNWLGWSMNQPLRYGLLGAISATLAIWIGLFPLMALFFNQFSWTALAGNIIMVPLVMIVLLIGWLAVLAEALGHFPGILPAMLDILVGGLIRIAEILEFLPGHLMVIKEPHWLLITAYYGVLTLAIFAIQTIGHRRLVFGLGGAVLIGWWTHSQWPLPKGQLFVDTLDVGHGDSMVVRSADSGVTLVDTGDAEATGFIVIPWLFRKGVSVIDQVMVTHGDADHAGGLQQILKTFKVLEVVHNGDLNPRAYEFFPKGQQPVWLTPQSGEWIETPGYLRWQVLNPHSGVSHINGRNDRSLVLRMHYGQMRLLVTGDADEASLPLLLSDPSALNAQILKVPHHGSALGYLGWEFFRAVDPQVAIISAGRRPGLPHAEVLNMLEHMEVDLRLTNRDGQVKLRLWSNRYELTTLSEQSL